MIKKILIFINLIYCFFIFSQEPKIDLYNYNIYGFNLNQSIDEVKTILKQNNIEFYNKESDSNGVITLDIISETPTESENRIFNYIFSFFSGKMYYLMISKPQITILEKVLKDSKNYKAIKHYDGRTEEFLIGDFRIIYEHFEEKILKRTRDFFSLYNKSILSDMWNIKIPNLPNVYIVKNNNAKLYAEVEYYNRRGFIRNMDLGEKVAVLEWKEKTFDGLSGTWALVETAFEKSPGINSRTELMENYYIFKNYLEKLNGKDSTLSNDKKIHYYIPIYDNLRLRASPDLQGKFIRSLIKGEKLELIEKGKADTVNGVKGTWVKVKTEKGEVGWCFDAYLGEVKK